MKLWNFLFIFCGMYLEAKNTLNFVIEKFPKMGFIVVSQSNMDQITKMRYSIKGNFHVYLMEVSNFGNWEN